jgi:PTH1 family peptidyl-tRNA hydrolase
MRVIVGLGNPGEKYKLTRHNIGFMAIGALAKKLDLAWEKSKKLNAEIAKSPLVKGGAGGLILVKPLTYMNNSGEAVQAVLSYFKKTSEALTVIHDDIDILLGKYKIAVDSRAAGHNGVQSIIDNLKTKNFKRVRIGVKTEALEKIPADKFVLQKFGKEELDIVNKLIEEIIEKNIVEIR